MNRWTPYFLVWCMFAVVYGGRKERQAPPDSEYLEGELQSKPPKNNEFGAAKVENYYKRLLRQKGPYGMNDDYSYRAGYSPRFRNDPYGQYPYGRNPYGPQPYGQLHYGQIPYGVLPIPYPSSYFPARFPQLPAYVVPTTNSYGAGVLPSSPILINHPARDTIGMTENVRPVSTLIPFLPAATTQNKFMNGQVPIQGTLGSYLSSGQSPLQTPLKTGLGLSQYPNKPVSYPFYDNRNLFYPVFQGFPPTVPQPSTAPNTSPTLQPIYIPPNNNVLLLQPSQGSIQQPVPYQNLSPSNPVSLADIINLLNAAALTPSSDQATSDGLTKVP